MRVTKLSLLSLIFFGIAALATLFPPYSYGEDRLSSQAGGVALYRLGLDPHEILPIKKRAFLFGQAKRKLVVAWDWDYQKKQSTRIEMLLDRKLLWSDLILEYLFAFLVGALIYMLLPQIYPQRKGRQDDV